MISNSEYFSISIVLLVLACFTEITFGAIIQTPLAKPPKLPIDQTLFQNPFHPKTQSFFGPDIVIPKTTRSGSSIKSHRWQGSINVVIDPAFTSTEVSVINAGLYDLYETLRNCLAVGVFPAGTTRNQNLGDYVYIQKGAVGSGCWATLGRQTGGQELNLSPECVYRSVVIHEMIHALGFYHEQQRPDRDSYVRINYGNIEPGTALSVTFDKLSDTETYGVPYDFNSIMHYRATDFGKNGLPTITSIVSGRRIQPSDVMTPSDKLKLRKKYNCA